MFCTHCGKKIANAAVICVHCGVPTGEISNPSSSAPKSRIVYILIAFFFGGLGVHNLYAGYSGRAVTQMFITLFAALFIAWETEMVAAILMLVLLAWILLDIVSVAKDAKGVRFS
ncbi:TPA: hypothetical protein DDW35_01515 [Candidatus Sumerlaeota bacterium]|nr:hypothetical protein [Candidatus Sumerlaeota bacterium]